jgi:small conductance mechanosensitive channel
MNNYLNEIAHVEILFSKYLLPFLMKVIGAFALWFVAGLIIRASKKVLIRALERRGVDPTLINYAKHTLGVGLKGMALILILGIFGFETTSFSAILAAAGVAIGVAWSGLLSNFAAGIFLILFRPFKIGDAITAGGVTGTVREIGLFATSIDSGDNLRYFVGNNKLFSDNILNYSMNPYRMAQFRIQLAHSVNPTQAIERFSAALGTLDGIRINPPPSGEIIEFNPMGALIVVRVACHQTQFTMVQSNGNQLISEILRNGDFPVPETRTFVATSADRGKA